MRLVMRALSGPSREMSQTRRLAADVAGYSRLMGWTKRARSNATNAFNSKDGCRGAAVGTGLLYICHQGNAMPGSPVDDPILKRFRDALSELYGDRLERVVLFGSRARGDAREDSDYDVAVFIKDLGPFWDEVDRLVGVETDLLHDTGAVINSMPYRASTYQDRTSLMREIRHEGVDL